MIRLLSCLLAAPLSLALLTTSALAEEKASDGVSYQKDVLPIFQAHCQGCHQPAKALGDYDMLSFDNLVKGGESGFKAIVAGKPEQSYLIDQIAVVDGKAEMPKNGKPLSEVEIETIRKWITEGAKNDAPSSGPLHDADNPPIYTRPPVITSVDYSPDGKLLAVAGYHEILLHNADGSGEPRRLIGLSERIEKVAFSPDGARLAAVGGRPGLSGEVQIWDVKTGKLSLSQPVTFDTIYGASWSPDGKLIAFGCSDNTVRAIDSTTGKQVLYQGSHSDWVRDTVFGTKGEHVVSVGRDMTTKLTHVETNRFIDNLTSITPKALKGGITSIDRHPTLDLLLIGGADGTPQVYRMKRLTNRVIGDNANLVRRFPEVPGRIFAVDYSADGKSIVVGSSLDGKGLVRVYSANFDDALPANIKGILGKRTAQWNAMEKAQVEEYVTKDVAITSTAQLNTGVYSVKFSPDGKTVAAAGSDGTIRLIDPATGNIKSEFLPVTITPESDVKRDVELVAAPITEVDPVTLPESLSIQKLLVTPSEIRFTSPADYAQLVVTGITSNGETIDLTRHMKTAFTASTANALVVASVTKSGMVLPAADGESTLHIGFEGRQRTVPVTVTGMETVKPISYVQDVNPVVGKLGCNAGTCHGAKDGKNGFKLSLRGYDPIYDIRAFTDDLASRRVNVASPDQSLMLMKASGRVPHVGGQLTKPGEPYYELIRRWIGEGAKLDLDAPRVSGIRIEPENPVVQVIGSRQQMRVIATYEDNSERDVTREAFIESGNTEIVDAGDAGLMTSVRRGEAPLLARFEGSYAATTMTVMGDRSGFAWQPTTEYSRIDELVSSKLQRMKILPSGLCTDEEFVRRVYIDLTGLPPTAEQAKSFLNDERESKVKRDALVSSLIGNEDFVDYWTNKWADLLQVNRKFLGPEGSSQFRKWIRDQVANNRPYDEFVYDILTASGSNKENPAASYYKILREPADTMENTTHLFLAIRFNCNKCHDHPFERWTQDQYYETAAFFAQTGLKADPEAKGRRIGGTAVEGAKPLYEIIYDKTEGDITHDRTGAVTEPAYPFLEEFSADENATRRVRLAKWMTSAENPYFARSYVNRLWGYMLGVGLIEPLDDIRAGNPASNPELLDHLTEQFIESGFDTRHLLQMICTSATYQRSIETNRWNADDVTNYSHAIPRRLPAEVLYDSIHTVLGATPNIPGVPKGTRAVQLPDAGVKLPDGFLANLGRPARESSCECERSQELQLGPVMALVGGPTVGNALSDPNNDLVELTKTIENDDELINEVVFRVLTRPATDRELQLGRKLIAGLQEDHDALVAQLAAYRQQIAKQEERRATAREAKIAANRKALEEYVASIKDTEAKRAADRLDRIAKAEAALNASEAQLNDKAAKWAATQTVSTGWQMLSFDKLTSTNKAKLTQSGDGVIVVTGPNGKTLYELNGNLDMKSITGVRIEAIAGKPSPRNGPGRSAGGNFVLSEFELLTAPKASEEKLTKAKFASATATFNQGGYDVNTAIDGQVKPNGNGWALAGGTGKNQTAFLVLEKPITSDNGFRLQIRMDQQYQDGTHSLGKFRISVTSDPAPFTFGLPEAIANVLKVSAEKRTPQHLKVLADHYKNLDADWKAKSKALAEAKKPLPMDPMQKTLQDRLTKSEEPLRKDIGLARLERAVELSTAQLANQRLTAMQDLAWALINNPAFLFNR